MFRQTIYDAFTKLTLREKTDVTNFLVENNQSYQNKKGQILTAIDAVIKEIPSFGGQIITLSDANNNIIAATIINNTGMEGFAPSHIISFFAVKETHLNIGVEHKMLQQVLSKTKGEIITRTQISHQQRTILTDLGFRKANTTMLFSRKRTSLNKNQNIARKITA